MSASGSSSPGGGSKPGGSPSDHRRRRPDGVPKPPCANGLKSSGRSASAHPTSRRRSKSMVSSGARAPASAARASSSSVASNACAVEAHRARQAAEDLGVGQRLADGRDGRLVVGDVGVPPRGHEVDVLDLRRGRQHDVGVAGGVGQEVLEDHGEEVLARQPLHDARAVGRRRGRVGVVDHERVDGRVELGQRVPEADHVDGARVGLRAGQRVLVERAVGRPRGRAEDAAAALAPRPDERRQAGDRAHHPRALAMVLDADQPADRRRARGGVGARERHHLVGRDAGDLLGARGRPGRELGRQALEALGVRATYSASCRSSATITCMSPSASAASVPGSGRTCQSAAAAVRVSSGSMTTTRAPALRACWTIGHWCRLVTIVFVPHSTMKRLCSEVEGAQADQRAGGLELPGGRRLPADRALQPAGAQAREEAPVHRGALHEPLGAGEAVGEHRLAAVLGDDRAQALGDVRERDVPRDRLEGARALGARAHQRLAQPIGAVRALEEVADLRAQPAAGERMLLDADELLGHAVAHRDLPRAGVRAVVRTSAPDDGRFGGHAARRGSHTARLAVHSYRRTRHHIVTEARGRPVAAGDGAVEHEHAARARRAVGLALARQRRQPAHDHRRAAQVARHLALDLRRRHHAGLRRRRSASGWAGRAAR